MRTTKIALTAASQVLKHDRPTHDGAHAYGFTLGATSLARFDFVGLHANTKVGLQAWRPGVIWATIATFENTDGHELSIEQKIGPGRLALTIDSPTEPPAYGLTYSGAPVEDAADDDGEIPTTSVLVDEDYVVSGSLVPRDQDGTDLTFNLLSGPSDGHLTIAPMERSHISRLMRSTASMMAKPKLLSSRTP